MKIKEHFGLGTPSYLQRLDGSREFIIGCEFEIEDIHRDRLDDVRITRVEDNSLRNNGREYTTCPANMEDTLTLFKILHGNLQLGPDPFSERTSIHVHVNVRELTLNEVRQLTLTYALLEPLFFDFVGETRKNSIFCVPLNYTFLPAIYKLPTTSLHQKWHKYTAFNLKPLDSFGTVEFRHLYGTADAEILKFWLTCLKDLYTFISTAPDFDLIQALRNGATPAEIARKVVPLLAKESDSVINEKLADTLLDVKLSVGGLK